MQERTHTRTRICLALLSVCLIAFLGFDLAIAKQRGIEPGPEAERWAAVGILSVQGGGMCSAALLDQRTVLTAAHCVYSKRSGKLYHPSRISFLAGWRDGVTAAKRTAVRVVAHRHYNPKRAYGPDNIAADIAIVELDEPIDPGAAQSFGPMDKIRVGAGVSVVSFSGKRSDVASINDACKINERAGNMLLLSCSSSPGMSGAPVFGFVNGRPRIVALISGNQTDRRTGEQQAIALAIRSPLGRVMIDAKASRSTPKDALPRWTVRMAPKGPQIGTATRKTVAAGRSGGLAGLTGSGGARTIVRPPASQ